jgi:hypothetical protein
MAASKAAALTPPADLLSQLDEQGAKGWTPNPGDTMMGVITSIKASTPSDYGIYPIVTIKPDDGDELVALHCFHSLIRNKLLEARPAVGERIAVKYFGEVEGKNSKSRGGTRDPYHSYSLVVDRSTPDEGSVSWDSFGADPDPTED